MLTQHRLDVARRLAQSTGGSAPSAATTMVMALTQLGPGPTRMTTVQGERACQWPDADEDERVYVSMLASASEGYPETDEFEYLMFDGRAGIATCPTEFAEKGPDGCAR